MGVVTPSARNNPLRTGGSAFGMVSSIIETRPDSKSGIAAPPPRYGTCTTSMFAAAFSSSPARCDTEPLPAEANVSRDGVRATVAAYLGRPSALLP